MKVTPWFDGRVKPAHVGVYEKKKGKYFVWQKWNGEFWCMFAWSRESASTKNMRSAYQKNSWRGVAQETEL